MPLTPDDIVKYKGLYLKSAKEYVTNIKLHLERYAQGQNGDEVTQLLIIDAHSIKGQSAMMEYMSTSTYAKLVEHVFRHYQESKGVASATEIQLVREAIPKLEASLNEIEQNSRELDFTIEIDKLKQASGIQE